jgi:hypothetical protein
MEFADPLCQNATPQMKAQQHTLQLDARVFVSAVGRELDSVRKLVKNGLEGNDYHPLEHWLSAIRLTAGLWSGRMLG